MMKYLACGGILAALAMGWLWKAALGELAAREAELAVTRKANELLEREREMTNQVLSAWNNDRTIIANVRSEVRATLKGALKDEISRAWAAVDVPAGVWEALRRAGGENPGASGGAAARLPGKSHAPERHQ